MKGKSTRSELRLSNFKKSLDVLKKGVDIKSPNEIEKSGIIQCFEVAFELGWKVLGDILESSGIDAKTPRDIIKNAYKIEYIDKPDIWFDALDNRNLTAHTYDKDIVKEVLKNIRNDYIVILEDLYKTVISRL